MHLPTTITPHPLNPRQTKSTSTLFLTTTQPGGGGGGGNILSSSVADSKLLWWQLLALIVGGALAVGVGGWWLYRHRRRVSKDKVRKAEVERVEREGEMEKRMKKEVEEEAKKAMKRRARRKGSRHSDSDSDWSEESEDYESVSDGGTIRPRRRKRRKRRERRKRRRRRDSSESDTSAESDVSYGPRRESKRDRYHSPPSPPPVPHVPKDLNKEVNFRDSVFSTYNSMKNAAVKLKYVEAKVKLKKQLEEEERIEAHRKAKIAEANRELEAVKRAEQNVDSAGSCENPLDQLMSAQPLIPPVERHTTSSGSQTALPTPPSRAVRKASHPNPAANHSLRAMPRQNSADSYFPTKVKESGGAHTGGSDIGGETSKLLGISRAVPRHPSGDMPGNRQTGANRSLRTASGTPSKKGELGDEISNLLHMRQPRKTDPTPLNPPVQQKSSEATSGAHEFQASWLSKPPPSAPSVPSSARATVYVPMNIPRDRPIIPKGQLAPAPKPKARAEGRLGVPKPSLLPTQVTHAPHQQSQSLRERPQENQVSRAGISMAGVGAGSNGHKWADRLRERR